jgi:hypothetical protein
LLHEQPAPSPSSSSLRTQAKKGSSGGLPHELAEEAANSLPKSWLRRQQRARRAVVAPSPTGGARPQASTYPTRQRDGATSSPTAGSVFCAHRGLDLSGLTFLLVRSMALTLLPRLELTTGCVDGDGNGARGRRWLHHDPAWQWCIQDNDGVSGLTVMAPTR